MLLDIFPSYGVKPDTSIVCVTTMVALEVQYVQRILEIAHDPEVVGFRYV